jgi:hypothetical protein
LGIYGLDIYGLGIYGLGIYGLGDYVLMTRFARRQLDLNSASSTSSPLAPFLNPTNLNNYNFFTNSKNPNYFIKQFIKFLASLASYNIQVIHCVHHLNFRIILYSIIKCQVVVIQ